MELLGFIARVTSSEQQNWDDKGLYTMQFVLVVLAPVLMAAGYYVLFVGLSQRKTSRKIADGITRAVSSFAYCLESTQLQRSFGYRVRCLSSPVLD